MSEIDYYYKWLDYTNQTLAIRPRGIGRYEAEIPNAKFEFFESQPANGWKTRKKKVKKKFSAFGSTRNEATLNFFRQIRLFNFCETPHGNFNTPYHLIEETSKREVKAVKPRAVKKV